jgi:hypothetical protein
VPGKFSLIVSYAYSGGDEMGYKVVYPQIGKLKYRKYRKPPNMVRIICSIAIIFVLILTLWQGGISVLLPGDPVVTENALQEMITSLRDGDPLAEAVTAFCREVVAGAQ